MKTWGAEHKCALKKQPPKTWQIPEELTALSASEERHEDDSLNILLSF